MKIEQKKWTKEGSWQDLNKAEFSQTPQLVLVFGGTSVIKEGKYFGEVKKFYPNSNIISGTTSGEILSNEVNDDSLSLTAIAFDKTTLVFKESNIRDSSESLAVGEALTKDLPQENLVHVMVFSDGLKVNGTDLVHGLSKNLPSSVAVTGGLVGDGSDFKNTFVGLNKAAEQGKIVVVGFYSTSLKVGYGSLGGWDSFGSKRLITKSEGNVLYELDGKPALQLYKEYLGDKAAGLPGTGLLFPLSLTIKNLDGSEVEVVRTLLAVDEGKQSMTFAGDTPQGVYAKLMKADFDKLIDGASGAANMSLSELKDTEPELAILISCVGRKLVLKERIEEEIDAVRNKVGKKAFITGFYSYGEICPTAPTEKQCQLHNQTMTITTFREE
ncbi:MAG TPA: FIST N-terminal domain-containing protein [Candidatus Limnocylindria bacterium]|nr:FIST N-terminal domain-containing protein [Candidatus Limnocylindria bacterium]